jgi:hypothetical protein
MTNDVDAGIDNSSDMNSSEAASNSNAEEVKETGAAESNANEKTGDSKEESKVETLTLTREELNAKEAEARSKGIRQGRRWASEAHNKALNDQSQPPLAQQEQSQAPQLNRFTAQTVEKKDGYWFDDKTQHYIPDGYKAEDCFSISQYNELLNKHSTSHQPQQQQQPVQQPRKDTLSSELSDQAYICMDKFNDFKNVFPTIGKLLNRDLLEVAAGADDNGLELLYKAGKADLNEITKISELPTKQRQIAGLVLLINKQRTTMNPVVTKATAAPSTTKSASEPKTGKNEIYYQAAKEVGTWGA